MKKSLFVNGTWKEGHGDMFGSINPSNGREIWSGLAANDADVDAAFDAAHNAFEGWSRTPLKERMAIVARYKDLAMAAKQSMGALIAKETGKQLWDALGEGGALSAKVDISLTAYEDRTGALTRETAFGHAALQHRAHGVMAVLGPYNFPAHLPNGQILPALIAGNTVVFKPSEQTPAVGEALIKLYAEAGFPPGVINMVQGARETGAAVLDHPKLGGVLFTGSASTGAFIHKKFGGRPEIVLALEMGGNNPLIAWDVEDADAAASLIAQSAFITTGQRCTCARRLIVPDNEHGAAIIAATANFIDRMSLGACDEESTIGPLISADIALHVVKNANALGGKTIRAASISDQGAAYVTPGLYDVTDVEVKDEEIFGPVLQVIRVSDWDAAIKSANDTKFGLAAGLISDDADLWDDFRLRIRAGVVNFNRPTTGAASFLPFGGPGASGNHNPGAYYAADFCAWPMASQVAGSPENLPMKGLKSS
ncbi:succinylglutamate-semialdehyde dehydrogenase [Hellea balneolensis]|uniref:succinylglutamate-semialdehyde dehydrogenase n=1 Tax=Hellea balneolensis TaxID=287478 RepID=UPI0003F7D2E2|nr:succinylglutamate-semialdehyde dehydrogenase [Hellea balneolensis]